MPSPTKTQRLIDDSFATSIRGPLFGAGNTFYVSSAVSGRGAGTPYGGSALTPLTTIDEAIGRCTAGRGDQIIVMPGHAETLTAAAGIVADVAGISIIGQGNGDSRPTISFGTATTADIDVDADNVTFRNIRFVCAIDDLAVMLDVNEDYCTFEDCEFVGPSTLECLNFVNLATTKDNFAFRRCTWHQPADPTGTDGAAATGAIYCVDSERITVEDCTFDGYFETACLHNKTTACKYLTWKRNNVNQLLTITGRRLLLVSSSTHDIGPDNDFIPGLGYRVQKTEDVNTATSDTLFTVAGKNLITVWTGEVTNAIGTVGDYSVGITSGAIMQAAGVFTSAAVGFMFQLNSDAGDTTLAAGSNAVSVLKTTDTNGKGLANRIIGLDGLGTLTLSAIRTAGDASDAIVHTIYYIPLEPGAHIVAAA